jgi:hypothetical protein
MRVKQALKKILKSLNINPSVLIEGVGHWSINRALAQEGLKSMVESLKEIVPDISDQYSSTAMQGHYWQLKVRAMHAFQTTLMLKALAGLRRNRLTVVDIGDSAGTHMIYLTNLAGDGVELETISVNLDPKAVKKILGKGLKAILCRAECLDLGPQKPVDLFTSFEMVEHLHNPAIFFRRLAKKSSGNLMVITVPYLKKSKVGLYHTRNPSTSPVFAEDEHIFELSPQDWTLLILHSGWRISYSETYYQYPRKLPFVSPLLALFWRHTDFEGFWGAILEKDTSCSDLYQDWEE